MIKDVSLKIYNNKYENAGTRTNGGGKKGASQLRQVLKYTLPYIVFLLAKSAQHAYGVRTGDYTRYRKYCTTKIAKLREGMQFKYGNRTKFNRKDITEDKADDKRVLQVALYTCERYWAFANECKFNQSIKQEHVYCLSFRNSGHVSRQLRNSEELSNGAKNYWRFARKAAIQWPLANHKRTDFSWKACYCSKSKNGKGLKLSWSVAEKFSR